MIKLTVNDEGFEEWLYTLHNRFLDMVQTMIDVFEVIKATINREGLVPLDTGRLETSFHYVMYENTQFIEMYPTYSAVDPRSGYDYAFYQHELENRGMWTYSAYTRAGYYGASNHHRHGTRGTDHYLFKGIDKAMSEGLMWTIIEQDYMELFNGGL